MSASRQYLSIREGLLPRPRIDALLEEGLRGSLIVMNAGQGYGKTYAAASYLKGYPYPIIWMHISRMDNVESRFWRDFLRAVGEELPELARVLEELGFPGTLRTQDALLRIFAKVLGGTGPAVLVVDEYHLLENTVVRGFFEFLCKAGIQNLCMLVISGVKSEFALEGTRIGDSVCRIGMEQLRLTGEEITALFAQHGIALKADQARRLERQTEGWPLAVNLLATGAEHNPQLLKRPGVVPDPIQHLFQKEYWDGYPDSLQALLLRLALLPFFTLGAAGAVGGLDQEATAAIKSNPFILYNPVAQLYTYHNLYREFLLSHQVFLDEAERSAAISAADWFSQNGYTLEAIELHAGCGNYDELVQAVASLPHEGYTRGSADFILRFLLDIPPEYREKNPLADYILARIHLNNMELDEAERLLDGLVSRLAGGEDDALLGEVYITRAALNMIRNRESYAGDYRAADKLLAHGSSMKQKNMLIVGKGRVLFWEGDAPGAADRMVEQMRQVQPVLERVLNGAGRGYYSLAAAELAYARFQMTTASEKAYTAIYRARENQQYDIILHAYTLLARVALVSGDMKELLSCRDAIEQTAAIGGQERLNDQRDIFEGWLWLKLGNYERIPGWILTGDARLLDMPPVDVGWEQLVRAEYLLEQQRFFELLGLLDWLEGLYRRRGLRIDHLAVLLLRAVALLRIHDEERALATLEQAFAVSQPQQIVAPYIELGGSARFVLDWVHRREITRLPRDWVESITQKSSAFAKRLSALRRVNEGQASRSRGPARGVLSRREGQILSALAQGLTREEIAGLYHISVNTVKSTIKSIYNKLGAVNRADAIRIASETGLL